MEREQAQSMRSLLFTGARRVDSAGGRVCASIHVYSALNLSHLPYRRRERQRELIVSSKNRPGFSFGRQWLNCWVINTARERPLKSTVKRNDKCIGLHWKYRSLERSKTVRHCERVRGNWGDQMTPNDTSVERVRDTLKKRVPRQVYRTRAPP